MGENDHAGWYSFGRGIHGELGRPLERPNGPEGLENADVRAVQVEGVVLQEIACGHFHNISLSTDHKVFAWGANSHGQLGTEEDGSTPTAAWQLQALLGEEEISHFCAGRNHSVFVTSTGRSFISGRLPSAEPGVSKVTSVQVVREIQLTDGSEEPEGRIIAAAVGESQTYFLSSDGELWSWLGEEDRQERRRILGHFQRPTARAILGLPRVAEVTCGLHHTLILTEERQIFSFGAGSLGQLGLGPCRRCPSPSRVTFPPQCDGCLCSIAAGFASSFAVTEQGWVYSWGCNEKCELGLGAAIRGAARPKPIDALYQVKVKQVSAGFAHTACVTDSGLLYLWGYGAYGQLGFGFDDLRSSLRLGRGWSGTKPTPGARADDAGFTLTGQWQPWQQAWPRRCRRGAFRSRRCLRVECGAYHTIAKASKELLSEAALKESEVLCPLPLEVSDLPAGTMALMEADQQWPPGAGLAECPRPVLRQKATRTVEIFRSLADLFWETKPSKAGIPETPSKGTVPQIRPKESFGWKRALNPPIRSEHRVAPDLVVMHPLNGSVSQHTSPRSLREVAGIPLPSSRCRVPMTTWTEVDEAVHKAFNEGNMAASLPELVANQLEVNGPNNEATGLPSSPSQGLARMECLTPRPFYLADPEEGALGSISGAPQPEEAKTPKIAEVGNAEEGKTEKEIEEEAEKEAHVDAQAEEEEPQAEIDDALPAEEGETEKKIETEAKKEAHVDAQAEEEEPQAEIDDAVLAEEGKTEKEMEAEKEAVVDAQAEEEEPQAENDDAVPAEEGKTEKEIEEEAEKEAHVDAQAEEEEPQAEIGDAVPAEETQRLEATEEK